MSVSRVIEVSFGNETVVYVNIDTAYYYNDGVIIKPTDGDLPDTYQVHWADSPEAQTTLETIGTPEGVPVPDELWGRSKVIYGWFYLHPTEDSSVTYKEIRIYKSARAGLPDGTEPTPSEHSTIDQLISAMNTAADKAEQNADSASSDADRAETARNEAETYATNAQTSASNAEASATTATNQAQIATTSATTATTAAQTATTKATEASDSASSAAESASSASDSADSASRSEQAAKISETNAADSESNASTYANSARGYAQTAQSASASASSSATSASNSANSASNSATSASQSASVATEAKADIEDMVESAKGYANASATNAASASRSADQAESAATNAATFATNAGNKAVEAAQSANTASSKATEASTSASTASQKATEASQSASQALSYKTDAESAKTASQTAQGKAEDAQTAAETAQGLAESARDSAIQAKDDAESAVASISGALADKAPIITDTASGSIASFTDGADDLPLKSLVVDINPVQDLSHGDPSPENICPISGWTSVDVEQSGKNQANVSSENRYDYSTTYNKCTVDSATGSVSITGLTLTEFIVPVKPNTQYTFSWIRETSIAIGMRVAEFTGKPNSFNDTSVYIGYAVNASPEAASGLYSVTFTTSAQTHYVGLTCYNGISTQTGVLSHWMFELGSTATPYSPYTGRSLTINLGQTVYGGHLDVLSGELTVYPYYASYNGETLTGRWISDRDKYVSGTTPTIGAQVVNIGAEGTEIQLEPHEVESLYGVNNLWADSGDTEIEYRADTKLFIERLTAPDSADMIADSNITSGQYFMVGNSLYKATANIANGSAIVVGTNCIRKSLSEALNEINA